jgi:hypothetical protein
MPAFTVTPQWRTWQGRILIAISVLPASATHGMVFAITERENRNRYGGSTPPRLIERWRQLIIIYQAVAGIGSVFGPAQGFETWILFQQKTQK